MKTRGLILFVALAGCAGPRYATRAELRGLQNHLRYVERQVCDCPNKNMTAAECRSLLAGDIDYRDFEGVPYHGR